MNSECTGTVVVSKIIKSVFDFRILCYMWSCLVPESLRHSLAVCSNQLRSFIRSRDSRDVSSSVSALL